MNQSTESDQSQSQQQRVNPLQILVNAAFLAYHRGVFSMKETAIISQSIDFFVETNQAIVPQVVQPPQQQQSPTTSEPEKQKLETITEEKVIFQSQ